MTDADELAAVAARTFPLACPPAVAPEHIASFVDANFDALCAHLATMHPSRYLTLIEGVTAVFLTGVHGIDDQNVALRLVALVDRLYDAGIPVVASGAKLDTIFSEEMLAGGYRKQPGDQRGVARIVQLELVDT